MEGTTAQQDSLVELIAQLEALPLSSLHEDPAAVDSLLSGIARATLAEAYSARKEIDGAGELSARASRALLRMPLTLHSEAVAEALIALIQYAGNRRLNEALVLELARRLVDVAVLLGTPSWKCRAYSVSAAINSRRSNYAVAIEHGWQCIKISAATGETDFRATGWNNLGIALLGCGLTQAAIRCFETALVLARQTTQEDSEVSVKRKLLTERSALNNITLSTMLSGDLERAVQTGEEAVRLADANAVQIGIHLRLTSRAYLARALLEAGNVGRARRYCNEALTLSTQIESEFFPISMGLLNGLCQIFEGSIDKGLAQVVTSVDTGRSIGAELIEILLVAIRAHEVAGKTAAAEAYRRELALASRIVQQESVLTMHRQHLVRLQAEEGASPASLERRAEMIERLAITTELREDPTALRLFRVGRLARLLAKSLDWSDADAEALEVAARLHDVGKISVADDVIRKRGALTESERREVQGHCAAGADLLLQTQLDIARLAADVATYHHENWDGSGYPYGIAGNAIPLAARIVAIADSFDAMTSDRPYRRAIGYEAALAELQAGAKHRYDPALVSKFVQIIRRLTASIDDVDAYLAEAADRSPFIRIHRQVQERLHAPTWQDGAPPTKTSSQNQRS